MTPMRMTTMQIAAANVEPNSGVVRATSLCLDSLVAGNQCNVVTPLELSGCCWVTWSPDCPNPDPGWISVMCGRFTQSYTWTEVREAMSLIQTAPNLRRRYNIAPTTNIDVVVAGNGEHVLMPMRWGLIPGWWKKPLQDAPATFNARAETVATKPMFRAAFKSRRCIIPASGFYEWSTEGDGKQPYFFSAADGSILAFAGLWERWRAPGASEDMFSATIIVTSANEWMRRYRDRMPVTLAAEDYDGWLSCASGAELFERPGPQMREWRVSKRVNRVGNDDDPTLIEPIEG
jgi:putative SOS response-associated peptidase YedK